MMRSFVIKKLHSANMLNGTASCCSLFDTNECQTHDKWSLGVDAKKDVNVRQQFVLCLSMIPQVHATHSTHGCVNSLLSCNSTNINRTKPDHVLSFLLPPWLTIQQVLAFCQFETCQNSCLGSCNMLQAFHPQQHALVKLGAEMELQIS